MFRIAMGRGCSSRPSISCFPGCAICSPTASTTAPICVTPLANSAIGRSRSSNAPLRLPAFICCPAAGLLNEPSRGSIETAAWPRISRRRSPAPKRGSTSPLYSSSPGDWPNPPRNFPKTKYNYADSDSDTKTKHPLLGDPAVRQALRLLVDRASVEKHIYGRTAVATGNFLNNPERFVSKNATWQFNVDKANRLLDEAGWKRGPDGIRSKDEKRLKFVFQTSINAPRQKTQAIIKQAFQRAGIDMELKSVTASVYFSSDVANPDTAR